MNSTSNWNGSPLFNYKKIILICIRSTFVFAECSKLMRIPSEHKIACGSESFGMNSTLISRNPSFEYIFFLSVVKMTTATLKRKGVPIFVKKKLEVRANAKCAEIPTSTNNYIEVEPNVRMCAQQRHHHSELWMIAANNTFVSSNNFRIQPVHDCTACIDTDWRQSFHVNLICCFN